MSNISGLRECWSDFAYDKKIENEAVVWRTSSANSQSEGNKSAFFSDDPTDDVEETIYLKETAVERESEKVLVDSSLKQAFESPSPNTGFASCPFDILPDELIMQILSLVPLKELCLNLTLVCKKWREFALSPILWQRLDFEETKLLTSESLTNIILSRCPLLKRLTLRGRGELSATDMFVIAKACPLLQQVSLSFCGQVNMAILLLFSKHCPSIQDINMEGCDITDDNLGSLSMLPLRRLNVSHCVYLSNDGLKLITTKCSCLQSINFDGVQWITDDAVQVMVENCYTRLKELWLDGANITDASVKAITRCKKLMVFSLSFCDNLSDETISWIKEMKRLYYLRLKKGVDFSAIALKELFNSLHWSLMENKTGLVYLFLPECSTLDDSAVEALAESFPNLATLDLSWCWDVTDQGFRHVILHCNRMKRMIICGLTEVIGDCLIDLPKHMPYLEHLDASQCNKMSDQILFELVVAVPKMTVINYYSEILQKKLSEQDRF